MDTNQLKKIAAIEAVKYVKSGMVLGLGTGSTANYAIREISRLINDGSLKDIAGIPSSKQTAELAKELNIKLITFSEINEIDLNIDGADEADSQLNLIKGGGGALLKEKIIAQASKRNVIVVDEVKMSESLGSKWAVPVEITEFAYEPVKRYVESLGAVVVLRKNQKGDYFKSEEGNLIIDCNFRQIKDVYQLNEDLNNKAGVVEHGLFIDIADEIIVGKPAGTIKLKKQ